MIFIKILAVLCGFLSAIFWYRSGTIEIPKNIRLSSDNQDLPELSEALKKQNNANKIAAKLTAAALVFQTISIIDE